MFITAYGAMVANVLIIKDALPVIFGLEETPGTGRFVERELLMIVTSLAVVVAFTSTVSVTADMILVVVVCIFAPGFGQVIKESWINGGFFIGFGVLTIAMTCQHSAFVVAGSLSNLTASRWARTTCLSLVISCILCMALGVTGYLDFLETTQGDVLNNVDCWP